MAIALEPGESAAHEAAPGQKPRVFGMLTDGAKSACGCPSRLLSALALSMRWMHVLLMTAS